MWLKELYKKLKYGVRYSSETYISYLRKIGINIGCRTTIFDPRTTIIDETRPWMISIGDDVQITSGVTILSHGFDWSVLKGTYGEVLGSSGGVEIGNNVFIGMHTTILKGVHIEYKFAGENGKNVANENVHKICENATLREVLSEYDDHDIRVASRIINYMMKFKKYTLLRNVMSFKNLLNI